MSSDVETSMVSQLLSDYKSFLSETFVTNINYQNATYVLSCIFNTILSYPTKENLITVWNFFVANQNGVVKENTALYAISVLNQNDRAIYNLLYTMFRQATNGSPPAATGDAMTILIRAPVIISFLQTMALNTTPGTEVPPDGTLTTPPIPITNVDTTRGLTLVNGSLTFDDSIFETYILERLAQFMTSATTDPRVLPENTPWNNGGTLSFTPSSTS